VLQMGSRLLLGAVVGAAFGAVLVFLMSRFLITDNMEAAVALLFAVGAFTVAELVLSEAGLFAAVILGIVAANQRVVPTSRISGFGETLEVLIIGSLFIVLGALVDIDDLIDQAWRIVALVAILVVVVRPLSVAVSMLRSSLGWRERTMIGLVDPRGVVAAATAAAFAGPVASEGLDSDFLLPAVFGVILGTGVIYGLSARPVANLLGVRRPPAKGVVVVGNDQWVAEIAACLQQFGVPVLVITSDSAVRLACGKAGVETVSILDPETDLKERLEELGAAKALVHAHAGLTQNLVLALLTERLGRRHVYRVIPAGESSIERTLEKAATARAFGSEVTDEDLRRRIDAGATIHTVDSDAPASGGDLVLASINDDGWVNFRPAHGDDAPGEKRVVLG
ncbi:MAG: cation:proton antiporter, partial [Microthrixaceae bacterium]